MQATIHSTIRTDSATMWRELRKPASLRYVASPILSFQPVDGRALPDWWEESETYIVKLSLFDMFPLGKHRITVIRIDEAAMEMLTHESGMLTRTWNHLLQIRAIDVGAVEYTDSVEIRAGLLTPLVWLFAQFFYRHRQRRWKVLLHGRSVTPR